MFFGSKISIANWKNKIFIFEMDEAFTMVNLLSDLLLFLGSKINITN